MRFEEKTLDDISKNGGKYGIGAAAVPFSDDLYTYLRITDIADDGTLYGADFKSVDDAKAADYILEENDIVFARTGASTGRNYFYDESDGVFVYAGFLIKFSIDPQKVNPKYVKYYCQSVDYKNWIQQYNTGSTRGNINAKTLGQMPIPFPERDVQDKAVKLLSSIDDKIKNDRKINSVLEKQVINYYKSLFEDSADKKTVKAETVFDISIGKTPPRKESKWFSTDSKDVLWVSISDLGNSGIYINDTSEKLTEEAVKTHNVVVVPDNTVLLSFKLTVGRVAITVGEMTTNEAIAHFKTTDDEIVEYLYCYLKCFDFRTMGNTSSIGTAVNSKIIKAMPFVEPTQVEKQEFHKFAFPLFKQIKNNMFEIQRLNDIKRILIARLLSGDLDLSGIDNN